jgi:hypothetical protein
LTRGLSTNPNVTVLGGKQRAPQSRLKARELEASVKQRAEPEAEAIAITQKSELRRMRKTLERSSSSDDEEEEEPLDRSRVIRHERIIKKM